MNIYKLNSLEFKHKLSITWGWKIRKYSQKQAGNQNWSKSFLYYAIKYLQYKAKSLCINFHVSYWCDQLLWGGWRLACVEVHKQTNKQKIDIYIVCGSFSSFVLLQTWNARIRSVASRLKPFGNRFFLIVFNCQLFLSLKLDWIYQTTGCKFSL